MDGNPMYNSKKNPQRPVDPQELNHSHFRWFILHFPAVLLKDAKIQRTTFVAVGLALAQFGTYVNGTRVNPSKKALHNLTGAHNDSITKVLDVLKACGALEVVDLHQSSNGGKPAEVFRFRRSPAVQQTLETMDATAWKHEPGNTTGEPGSTISEPGNTTGEPGNTISEDNRNVLNPKNSLNGSVANAPSLSPSALSPSGRAEESKESGDALDEKLDEMFMEPSFEELLKGI